MVSYTVQNILLIQSIGTKATHVWAPIKAQKYTGVVFGRPTSDADEFTFEQCELCFSIMLPIEYLWEKLVISIYFRLGAKPDALVSPHECERSRGYLLSSIDGHSKHYNLSWCGKGDIINAFKSSE